MAETTPPAQISQVESMGGSVDEVQGRTKEVDVEIDTVKAETEQKIGEVSGGEKVDDNQNEKLNGETQEEKEIVPPKTDKEKEDDWWAGRKVVKEKRRQLESERKEWERQASERIKQRQQDLDKNGDILDRNKARDELYIQEVVSPILQQLRDDGKWVEYFQLRRDLVGGESNLTFNPEELAKLRTYMTADGNADLDESLRVFAKKIKDSYKNRRDQYATLKEFIESGSSGYDMIAAKNSLRFTEDL